MAADFARICDHCPIRQALSERTGQLGPLVRRDPDRDWSGSGNLERENEGQKPGQIGRTRIKTDYPRIENGLSLFPSAWWQSQADD